MPDLSKWIKWEAGVPAGNYWLSVKREDGSWQTSYSFVHIFNDKAIMSNGEQNRDISYMRDAFDCWIYHVLYPRRPGDDDMADQCPNQVSPKAVIFDEDN